MRKFILFFVLLLIFAAFLSFFWNVYKEELKYFANKANTTPTQSPIAVEVIPSVYKDYTQEDYEKALMEKRVVLLYFTSNWCTECISQDKLNEEVFKELDKEGIVALRIHILDSEATTESQAVAKKFDVLKENTLVFLDGNGAVYAKVVGGMTKDNLKQKLIETKEVVK